MMNFKTVDYKDGQLIILDQTLLPNEEKYIKIDTADDLWDAIYQLKVRGAPAIGVASAYGVCAVMNKFVYETKDEFIKRFYEVTDYIRTSRPTAVNLFYAMNKLELAMNENKEKVKSAKEALLVIEGKAVMIHEEDKKFCRAMGENGLTLLKSGMSILTHCNAGALATSGIGTCLAPIYLGVERGYDFKIYSDETRPLLQGARLTSWEMKKLGVDVTLICDNMAASLMSKGKVDAVVVGCDRMASNGDGANKIGTLGVAILAKHFGIPFYMYVPSSTIDMSIKSGDDIKIELRDSEEIYSKWYDKRMAPNGINGYNPAFDVTPHELISAVVTEKGVIKPPYDVNLKKILG